MDSFAWNNKLATGNDSLDFEHMQLLRQIENCMKLTHGGTPKEDLVVRLNEIHRSLADHFENEEMIARKTGRHHSDVHLCHHQYLLGDLRSKIADFVDGGDSKSSAQGVLVFLYDRFVSHIDSEDKKLFSQVA